MMGAFVEVHPQSHTKVLSLNTLLLGLCFRPTNDELIDYYLRSKINENGDDVWIIHEIDVYKCVFFARETRKFHCGAEEVSRGK